jgi:hypothetical protein
MSIHDEEVWRAALVLKGRDWVARELQLRAGQPGDDVLDVVYAEPHPTREFCQKWCADQENHMFSMSANTKAVLVVIVVLAAVSTMAVSSMENYRPIQDQYLSANHALSGDSGPPTNLVEDPTPSVNSRTSSGMSRASSLCAYSTYQTTACSKSP